MKLWIDGQCLQTASRHRGIGRYVTDLIRAIRDRKLTSEIMISFNAAMTDEAVAARDFASGTLLPASNIHIWEGVAEAGEGDNGYTERRRLSEIALAHHVSCLRPDVALSASPFEGAGDLAVPLPPGLVPGIPVASIFYDAIPHRYSTQYLGTPFRRAYYYRRLQYYRNFDLNLCISEYSTSECIELSGNSRSVNISAGVSQGFVELSSLPHQRPTFETDTSKFILDVGSLDWRKNADALVDAFALLPEALRSEFSLVIAGDYLPQRIEELRARWASHGLRPDRFISLGHVADRELVSLYKSASVLVQPSLLEGFGLTALEAMSCGTPVVASSTGALPEILEDPDLLFDPTNPADMARRIARILDGGEWTRTQIARGLERAQRYSFVRSAELAAASIWKLTGKAVPAPVSDDVDAIRRRTAKKLSCVAVAPEIAAQTLARAEPDMTTGTRLLVEATSITRKDLGTGIQRVVREVIRHLLLQGECRPDIVYCDGPEGFFEVSSEVSGWTLRKTPKRVHPKRDDVILMLDSSWEFHQELLPVLLSARMRGARIISCLYDMLPLRQGAFCHPGVPPVFVSWLQAALTYSTSFVCISRTVADELYQTLDAISFPRTMDIGYWRLGADFAGFHVAGIEHGQTNVRRGLSLLMVGTVEPRKGHRVALDAMEILWKEGLDVHLNIIGKAGWETESFMNRLRSHPTAAGKLSWRSNVDDKELSQAYADCDALVAASFGEGFGLPLVEALRNARPVIASDIPVFREVTEGNALVDFFDVGCPLSLAKAIRRLLTREPQPLNFRPFSWSQSAAELRNMVMDGRWYRSYRPASEKPFVSIYDHGRVRMSEPLTTGGRRHRMELVQGPIRLAETLRFILRITNLSEEVWASESVTGKSYGVFLCGRLFDANGAEMPAKIGSSRIPFVLIPGDSHYVGLEIPRQTASRAACVEIEMMQQDVGWWGSPLRVELSKLVDI